MFQFYRACVDRYLKRLWKLVAIKENLEIIPVNGINKTLKPVKKR